MKAYWRGGNGFGWWLCVGTPLDENYKRSPDRKNEIYYAYIHGVSNVLDDVFILEFFHMVKPKRIPKLTNLIQAQAFAVEKVLAYHKDAVQGLEDM